MIGKDHIMAKAQWMNIVADYGYDVEYIPEHFRNNHELGHKEVYEVKASVYNDQGDWLRFKTLDRVYSEKAARKVVMEHAADHLDLREWRSLMKRRAELGIDI